MKNKMNLTVALILGVFGLVGIVFIFITVSTYVSDKQFREHADVVTGEIQRVDKEYHHNNFNSGNDKRYYVYVGYEYNGVQYDNILIHLYTAGMYKGKEVTLYVNPVDPTNPMVKGESYTSVVVTGMIEIMFTVISGMMLYQLLFKKKKIHVNVKMTGFDNH